MLLEHHSVIDPRRMGSVSGKVQSFSRDIHWTPHQTVAFLLLTCGAFWLAVGAALFEVLRLHG